MKSKYNSRIRDEDDYNSDDFMFRKRKHVFNYWSASEVE